MNVSADGKIDMRSSSNSATSLSLEQSSWGALAPRRKPLDLDDGLLIASPVF
ncbi:MAG: hypothetical protein IT290_11005 [Deltaproteobacteria bacterium]|nr:hypothetical protein [Deltaproteobacteria bacterium]